jgi:predicted DNA-binding protein (MmcQ/YjbR family)
MIMIGASEKIHKVIIALNGVKSETHRFGGTEYKLGKREIGHVHGDYLVDIPFPMKVRNELIEKGEAKAHDILPESGWVSLYLRKEDDVQNAIKLLKKSFDIAVENLQKKKRE